jgi:DNA-binding CsgD family transcriptional regulator
MQAKTKRDLAPTPALRCDLCGLTSTIHGTPFTPESLLRHKFRFHSAERRTGLVGKTMPKTPALSNRQQQILELLFHGMTALQISTRLRLRFPTVNTHIRRAYKKLGVKNRASALMAYLKLERDENRATWEPPQVFEPGNLPVNPVNSSRPAGFLKFCPWCGCNLKSIAAAALNGAPR